MRQSATSEGGARGLQLFPVASSQADDSRIGDFERVVRQHSPALVRTLTLVVLDREVAADIAQDAFLRLHLHWETVSEHADVGAWLYRVALNRATDYRRSLARLARLIERLGHNPTTEQRSEPWQPKGEFVSVLKSLSRRQREAAALHYIGDLSIPEVARVMGISEGAVNSHLYRARLALKSMLEEK